MAVRGDIIIDWLLSPRIITVSAPSVAVSMQDLHDTLRYLEAQPDALDNPSIVDSSGKENLGGGVKVGLSVTLQNAKVAFEARSGPEWVLCSLEGGNLVAVDTSGINIDPRHPTAFITVDRTSSASATLQEQEALQYSSYQNAVWLDATLGPECAGTVFPLGTREHPVNNIQDAILIATDKGFDTIQIIGNYTFSTGDNIEGFIIKGQNSIKSNFTIEPGALTGNVELHDATVTGTLDGDSLIRECYVGPLVYFSGFLEKCVLANATIYLGGNAVAMLIDCWSGVPGAEMPTIDMGGSGQQLAIRGYVGGIRLTNRTGTDPISIDMHSGHLNLADTCTAGDIYARGVMQLTDDTGPSCTVHTKAKVLTSEDEIPLQAADAVMAYDITNTGLDNSTEDILYRTTHIESKVYIDTELVVVGDGSQKTPFNNFDTAKDYAEANGIFVLVLHGSATIPSNFKNFIVEGIGVPIIETNGQDLRNSKFYQCMLKGTYIDAIIAQDCALLGGFALNGFFENCALYGDMTCVDGSNVLVAGCFSGIAGLSRPTISLNGVGTSKLSVRSYSGGLTILDVNNISDEVTVEIAQGSLTLDASCSAGTIVTRGLGNFVDNSTGSTVVDETVNIEKITESVWNKILTNIGDFATAVWNKVI